MSFVEDFKKFKRDEYGFVVLDSLFEKYHKNVDNGEYYTVVTHKNGNRYYYKNEGASSNSYKQRLTSYNHYYGKFGNNDNFLLSEVVNSRLVNMLGLYSPKCYLAKVGNCRGVISQDYCDKYPAAYPLDQYTSKYLYMGDSFIFASIEELAKSKHLSDNVIQQIGLASLIYLGTGQGDRNQENLAIYEGEKPAEDQVILIDHANTKIAFAGDSGLISREYQDEQYYPVINITSQSYEISDFYNELAMTDYISKNTIATYLSNLEKVLHNNNFITDINAEVMDECGLTVPREFMDMSKEILYITGEHIQNAYSMKELHDTACGKNVEIKDNNNCNEEKEL